MFTSDVRVLCCSLSLGFSTLCCDTPQWVLLKGMWSIGGKTSHFHLGKSAPNHLYVMVREDMFVLICILKKKGVITGLLTHGSEMKMYVGKTEKVMPRRMV